MTTPVLTEAYLLEQRACPDGLHIFQSFGQPELVLTPELLTEYYNWPEHPYLEWVIKHFSLTGELHGPERFMVFDHGDILAYRRADGTGRFCCGSIGVGWAPESALCKGDCPWCRYFLLAPMPLTIDAARRAAEEHCQKVIGRL